MIEADIAAYQAELALAQAAQAAQDAQADPADGQDEIPERSRTVVRFAIGIKLIISIILSYCWAIINAVLFNGL